MSMQPVDIKLCSHGKPEWDYCPLCTFTGAPRGTIRVTVSCTLALEVERHWSLTELAKAVEDYLNQYVDTAGYQPSTFYLKGVSVDAASFRKG